MKIPRRSPVVVVVATVLLGWGGPARAGSASTERVSVSSAGVQGDSFSFGPSISANGRYVAFTSFASTLVAGDVMDFYNVFLRDRRTGRTTLVSMSATGTQANRDSGEPAISGTGRYVAFESNASDVVAGDTNDTWDVFVRDRGTDTTARVSLSSAGAEGNDESHSPSISSDGRFIAFYSSASNLVPGDTNNFPDVFVHDRRTGAVTRVSVSRNGAQGDNSSLQPAISADGRHVVFTSYASTLVPGATDAVHSDVFVRDLRTGSIDRVSVSAAGAELDDRSDWPAVSADGRHIAFRSHASNVVPHDTNGVGDIFVRDRRTAAVNRISVSTTGVQANGASYAQSISADGRHVAFYAGASNLVHEDTNDAIDVFVRDRQAGTTSRVSVSGNRAQANDISSDPRISPNGRSVAFSSWANNLVRADTNENLDVFVRDLP
jgi:Tol biopolymer transport system component